MKKIITTAIAALFVLQSFVSAEIIETNSIHDLKKYIRPETLVLLDIDNTLMEPTQTLGSDQWFCHRIDYHENLGLNANDALEKALSEWMSIQSVTKVKVVEPGTAELVAELQKDGYTIMGLTTRGLGLSTRTIFQLQSLGIDLTTTAPSKEDVFFMNHHGVLFHGGILFTAGTHKGVALAKLLHQIEHIPESIVFINDKKQNIQEVEVICEKYGVPFTGLRYGYIDEKVNNFRVDIADIQLEHFGHIISDDEAERCIKSTQTCPAHAQLSN